MPERRAPVWGYRRPGAVFGRGPAVAGAGGGAFSGSASAVAPALFAATQRGHWCSKSFMYVFLVGALYLVIAWRYGEPFWRSLGWTFPIPHAGFASGCRARADHCTFGAWESSARAGHGCLADRSLINSRASLAAIILFGVLLAPIFEEMLFRGFLLPLLARSVGPWLGNLAHGGAVRASAWRAESLGVATGGADRRGGDGVRLSCATRRDRRPRRF